MRKLFLMILGLVISGVAYSQSIEPLQEKFDNKISPNTYVDPSLMEGDVIVSNSKGDKLMSYALVEKNTYYVAIKLADGTLYYGLVWPKYMTISEKDYNRLYDMYGPYDMKEHIDSYVPQPEEIDILNGLRVDGQVVYPNGEVKSVYLYRTSDERAKDVKLLKNKKLVSPSGVATYNFANNGTGKLTWNFYDEYMAPQAVASSWREGGRTRHGYTGGYYFSVEGTCTQNITWKIKDDKITIKFISEGTPSVKATLEEMKPESDDHWEVEYKRQLNAQFRADFSTNEDVKKAKKQMREKLVDTSTLGEVTFHFAIVKGVGLVLFRNDGDGFKYWSGLVLCGINPEEECYRVNVFDYTTIFSKGKKAYENYRMNKVTSHQRIYETFASNARNVFGYMMSDDYATNYFNGCTIYDVMEDSEIRYDLESIDDLGALQGMTQYHICNVNPFENIAEMFYIRQKEDRSQICLVNIKFTDDGAIVAESLNEKNVRVSEKAYETKALIEEQDALLMQKQNKKNKAFKTYYAAYTKKFKKVNLDIRFNSFGEMREVDERLSNILNMQNEYLTILKNCQ
ncbi:MAG: hypothetical protein J6V19_07325 [Alistipes sp.]|nr:hypothetical protein [Alistipes sp.]